MKLNRPPWVTPAPPGWPDALWAAMWAVRYVLATLILLACFAVAWRFL